MEGGHSTTVNTPGRRAAESPHGSVVLYIRLGEHFLDDVTMHVGQAAVDTVVAER